MSRRIIVHSLDHAKAAADAAAALGRPVILTSAPGAGIYAGPRWFAAVVAEAAAAFPGAALEGEIDCGGEAGTVLAALRAGFRRVRFSGADEVRAKLAAIAAAHGAAIVAAPAEPVLDLITACDATAACRAFLAGEGTRD